MLPLLVLLVQAAAAPDGGTTPVDSHVYSGRSGQLHVHVPRWDGDIAVDGVLDEPVWARAAVLTGFSQYIPEDGQNALDSTEVLVWYSADAIHFGIRAYEPHAPVNVRLSDRDRIEADDHLLIILDTFNDARRARVFGVNPLGIQSDGVMIETQEGTQRGLTSARESSPVDLSPDFVYESRGRLTEYGYEVEVRIPFQSLRFRNRARQTWGINVLRRVQHSGHEQTWTPARRGRASFLAQSGTLEIHEITGGRVLDVTPVATTMLNGKDTATGWSYGSPVGELGGNIHWGITSNLSLNATVNPDFSQIEADAGRLETDPRREVIYPEKRPFFLEGSEQFEVPNGLIHTRRIVSPNAAAKLAGKVSNWNLGLLSAQDSRAASRFDEPALVNIARIQRDVGTESTVGFVFTQRAEGDFGNHVIGVDGRLIFRDVYSVSAQVATSRTTHAGTASNGVLWDVSLNRRGRALSFTAGLNAIDPEFVAANGHLGRVDQTRTRFRIDYTTYGAPGARVESWTRSLSVSANWLRQGLFGPDRHMEDWKSSIAVDAALRGGWRLGASFLWERFFFPAYHYAAYAIERSTAAGTDTIPYLGLPAIYNYDLVIRVATPHYSNFSGNLSWIIGRDENFDEWSPAFINLVNGGFTWSPHSQLRIDPSYVLQHYVRTTDWSTVAVRSIPRLKVEYQATRAIFLRFVGQYSARYRDALRDDGRSDDPILIRNPATGVYERTVETRSNDLRVDWLFSYRPTPGTVVFVGYGADLTEPLPFRLRDLERTSDQLFLKLSYLFRL